MESPKVIITKQKVVKKQFSLENEIGLSSYDLALLSINKIINKKKASVIDANNTTFLI